MKINLSADQKNATPAVVQAIAKLKEAGGGELCFEKGEYHFFKEGTVKQFFAVSNNTSCDKHMVFPITNAKNITVDGGDSVFVFHDVVFPIMISQSENIILQNFTVDTGKSPLVDLWIRDVTNEGFHMDFDKQENPFFIKDGGLFFERETGIVGCDRECFALYRIGAFSVQYLATGNCGADLSNLPASLMKCDVSETATGVFARYQKDNPSACKFNNTKVSTIVDGKRDVDVICIDRSQSVTVRNITVARGIGMGVIGQISTDLCIDGFCTDITYHENAHQTLTADSLHFVNCDGRLEIKNCRISDTMDDAINVHGMYTSLIRADGNTLYCKIMHPEQRYFNPYREGDRLEIIDSNSFGVAAEFFVASAFFREGSADELVLKGCFRYGSDRVKSGFWVENPDRMPQLHMHHNHFYNFPHNRISGGGEMLIENNRFYDCAGALWCIDLARYWYESGRVKHLVFRDNILENCNALGGSTFILIGVDGVTGDNVPVIHQKIEIIGNRFTHVTQEAIKAEGVAELIVEGNLFEA